MIGEYEKIKALHLAIKKVLDSKEPLPDEFIDRIDKLSEMIEKGEV